MIPIRRALFSVSNKRGIVSLAQTLRKFGCEIISTGGTRKVLEGVAIPVTRITEVSGNPEAFGGRMKTLSFPVASAILYHRDRDLDEAGQLGIEPIDMVVCNLYPFKKYLEAGADLETLIEQIDIGGPTLIRAAAKNYAFVAVVTDPGDYPAIEEELKANSGTLSHETRQRLMRKALHYTADYDALIATALDALQGGRSLRLAYGEGKKLRYGENPHQQGYWLKERDSTASLRDLVLLGGKELSYNNIVDIQSAIEAVRDLSGTGCAVIKHTTPCGLSESDDQRLALELAWKGDPVSAFGSVIAFNRPVQPETVRFLGLDAEDRSRRKFVEAVVAPGYDPESIRYLAQHKSLRVVSWVMGNAPAPFTYRFVGGSLLMQDRDQRLYEELKGVTKTRPEPLDVELIEFGIKAVRSVQSNAIVVVRRVNGRSLQLLGMGGGQPNRRAATQIAISVARENLEREYTGDENRREEAVREGMTRTVLVSDAFFPFPDSIEICARAGIRLIVQPGGSIRDESVIRACDELGIAMVMTSVRHFRH
jgi:phosphoribosylaminoimidazolecarboxamide formyltransferase/IMP cyclohydrolase